MPIITGTIQDEAEALYVGNVVFENLDAPCAGGSHVTGPNKHAVITGVNGALPAGFRLAPGRTQVEINGRKSKTFTVPEGNGTFDLATLMAQAASLRTRVIIYADTIAELKTYRSASNNYRAEVLADNNGVMSVFKWLGGGTQANDDVTYIRPDDYDSADPVGLWVRIL